MNKKEVMKGIITLQAIILAGLLAWAQLWAGTYEIYYHSHQPIWTISLSLAAIYVAALSSLLSIIAAIHELMRPPGYKACKWTLTFSLFSIFILLLIILTSAITILGKAFIGASDWYPATFGMSAGPVTVAVTVIGLIFFIMFHFCCSPSILRIINRQEDIIARNQISLKEAGRVPNNTTQNGNIMQKTTVILNARPIAKNRNRQSRNRRIRG